MMDLLDRFRSNAVTTKRALGTIWDKSLSVLDPERLHQWAAIERSLQGCASVLDLGCGRGGHIRNHEFFENSRLVGVDVSEEWTAELPDCYREVLHGDLLSVLASLPSDSFDAVMAIDVIEHFIKSDGHILLQEMARVSRSVVTIATPNGFVHQPPATDNPFNEHLSGWTYRELKTLGFTRISGHFGFKSFRGSFGLPRLRPAHLGYFASALTARLCAKFPTTCYQLVAVKSFND